MEIGWSFWGKDESENGCNPSLLGTQPVAIDMLNNLVRLAVIAGAVEFNIIMSRNARTRTQLLSVYYIVTPYHACLLNTLSSMGITL